MNGKALYALSDGSNEFLQLLIPGAAKCKFFKHWIERLRVLEGDVPDIIHFGSRPI